MRAARASGFRLALVGCGYWGAKHARVLHADDSVDELVLVDSRDDRLQNLTRIYKVPRCYPALGAALDHVDAVVVATPPSTHVPLALAAIEAGKHVLVEKPLALTSAGARTLMSAAAAAGVVLMVGHTFEFDPAVRKLAELVRADELGDLYYLDSARLNLGLYQSDVNVIVDLAPHDVSIVNYVLGRQPVAVQAWASRHAHRRLEDVAYLRMYYDECLDDGGLTANIHVSWLDPCKVRRITVVGSRKMAVYDDLAAEERIRVLDKGVCPPAEDGDFAQPPMSYRHGDIVVPFISADEPLAVQDRHFVECIASGARPLSDGEDGLSVVETLEAAEWSRKLGRTVHLKEIRSGDRLSGPSLWDGDRSADPWSVPSQPAPRADSEPLLTVLDSEAG
jgi:predicted dehydrogenase